VAPFIAYGHLFGDVLAFGMTLCMAIMMLIIRQHHETPILPAACLSALLCPLLVWPFAAPLDVAAIDLLKLFLFGTTQFGLGLVFLNSRWSDGPRHGECADQHAGNAAGGRLGVGLLQ
jgi:drug/metabolite transporter (DMT)-like permease